MVNKLSSDCRICFKNQAITFNNQSDTIELEVKCTVIFPEFCYHILQMKPG